jgi:FixJ family two-component response regulator
MLVIHYDRSIRGGLARLGKLRHEVVEAKHVAEGIKRMNKAKPDVIVVGHDGKKEEGARLLRYLRDNVKKIPVVVVFSGGGGVFQPLLMKLGAKGFVEYPVDQTRFDEAVRSALDAHKTVHAPPPPITEEEQRANLSMLETALNKRMRCFAGKNLVYIQSMILGGRTSKPRICLKCPLRAEFGLNREVYYEFIRDVCCTEPAGCEAVRQFQAAR